jgi:hypothetical protein
MVSTMLPKILFNQFFWWTIAFVLIVTFYFLRKKSPPPFPGARKSIEEFCKKHKKKITKISDIFVICIILLWSYIFLPIVLFDLRNPIESESTRTFVQHLGFMCSFIWLTIWSGISGFWIGLLSIFHSNITIIKRIILLIICLLPIVFTILQMLTEIIESPWSIIQNCLFFSVGSWIINMPSVIVGKSSFELLGNMVKKVQLMLSHHAS